MYLSGRAFTQNTENPDVHQPALQKQISKQAYCQHLGSKERNGSGCEYRLPKDVSLSWDCSCRDWSRESISLHMASNSTEFNVHGNKCILHGYLSKAGGRFHCSLLSSVRVWLSKWGRRIKDHCILSYCLRTQSAQNDKLEACTKTSCSG